MRPSAFHAQVEQASEGDGSEPEPCPVYSDAHRSQVRFLTLRQGVEEASCVRTALSPVRVLIERALVTSSRGSISACSWRAPRKSYELGLIVAAKKLQAGSLEVEVANK